MGNKNILQHNFLIVNTKKKQYSVDNTVEI